MPALVDERANPTIYRALDGEPSSNSSAIPLDVFDTQVTLRDRVTVATIMPLSTQHRISHSLYAYLTDQMNKEIENGDTYPMLDVMSVEEFSAYWFQNFGAVMLLGNIESSQLMEEQDWATLCLGSFYIRPNYPGRASHVCTAGFLVTDAARNKGVGRLMGEAYLNWAPLLGYTYSVFNLVFETNVASCRIWDALGFRRIGRVKGAGNLKSYPGQFIDAIIYGRDLGTDEMDLVNEERFDKIKFYLKYDEYPSGADRAEKSRLRSAATHYKLLENGKLMLKDKEVISDPQQQYDIARKVHVAQHVGINKTTATIALKYHWVRIKETASLVIKNCTECKELGKSPGVRPEGMQARRSGNNGTISTQDVVQGSVNTSTGTRSVTSPSLQYQRQPHMVDQPGSTSVSPQVLSRTLPRPHKNQRLTHSAYQQQHHSVPVAPMAPHSLHHPHRSGYMPLDPQMMLSEEASMHHRLAAYNPVEQSNHRSEHLHPANADQDDCSFQAMLGDGPRRDSTAGLDMLIDQEDEGDLVDVRMEEAKRGTGSSDNDGGPGKAADEAKRKWRAEKAARDAVDTMRMSNNG